MPRFIPRQGYIERQTDAMNAVCRIEIDGDANGTGFLVGPDTVLTNHHVLAAVLAADGKTLTARVECRFDVDQLDDGAITPGTPIRVVACLAVSPNAPSEFDLPGFGGEPPTLDELDYALIRLERPFGTELTPGGRLRNWIALPEKQPAVSRHGGVYVVQHPLGGPAAIAARTDGMEGYTLDRYRARLTYHVDTLPGSSGSPCFNDSFEIIALHNFGSEEGRPYQRGIPIALIRQDIVRKGFSAEIPPLVEPTEVDSLRERLEAFRMAAEGRGEVKHLITDFQDALKPLGQTLSRLNIYKYLHDFLHAVQTGTLPALLSAVPQSGPINGALLVEFADTLDVSLDEPIRLAQGLPQNEPNGAQVQARWLQELRGLARALRDAPGLESREQVLAIRRLTRIQMPRLNAALLTEAQKIDFPRIETMLRRYSALAMHPAGASADAAIEALTRTRDNLYRRIEQHQGWQTTENDQLQLEDLIVNERVPLTENFHAAWKPTWSQIQSLCDADQSWEILGEIRDLGGKLQGFILKESWNEVAGVFGQFRRRSRLAFKKVDQELLEKTRQFAALSEPIEALLEVIQ